MNEYILVCQWAVNGNTNLLNFRFKADRCTSNVLDKVKEDACAFMTNRTGFIHDVELIHVTNIIKLDN